MAEAAKDERAKRVGRPPSARAAAPDPARRRVPTCRRDARSHGAPSAMAVTAVQPLKPEADRTPPASGHGDVARVPWGDRCTGGVRCSPARETSPTPRGSRRSTSDEQDAVPQAVGIDVSGTKVVALRVTSEGKELARAVRPHARRRHGCDARDAGGGPRRRVGPEVVAVGVGAAGLVEGGTGVLRFRAQPRLARRPDRGRWSGEPRGTRVIVENDRTAGAYGEYPVGAARGVATVLYIGVGTGIGGGFDPRRFLYRGAHGFAAEVGHIVGGAERPRLRLRQPWLLGDGGERHRPSRVRAGRGAPASRRSRRVPAGDPDAVTGHMVVDAARDGDAVARGIITRGGADAWGRGSPGWSTCWTPRPSSSAAASAARATSSSTRRARRSSTRWRLRSIAPAVPIVGGAPRDGQPPRSGAALLALEDRR